MLNNNKMAIPICLFTILLIMLVGCDAYTFECLDSCQCDTGEKVINCHSGTRARLFIPETRLLGFNIIQATNNNIKELPSEDILLEKFPDLKALDVKGNVDFNCSSLEQYKRIILPSDCNNTPKQIDQFEKLMEEVNKKRQIKRLFSAVRSGNLTEVGHLLDSGLDANSEDEYRIKILYFAVEKGNEKIVELLVDKGADLDARTDRGYWTPLHKAAQNGDERIASILIRKGANITCTTNDDDTALHWAAWSGSVGIVRTLLTLPMDRYGQAGKAAFVNAQNSVTTCYGGGFTALHKAYQSRKMDIVKLLEENGADGTIENIAGMTPKEMF